MKESIELSDLAWLEKSIQDESFPLLQRPIVNFGLNRVGYDEGEIAKNPPVFGLTVPAPSVPNQHQTGRCWMFAGYNIIRNAIAKELNLASFDVSYVYLQFFDKLEKANFFLEKAMERLDKGLEDIEIMYLLEKGIADGGHFAMFANLASKYGIVPENAMRATVCSECTPEMNYRLRQILAEGFLALRKAHKNGKGEETFRSIKKKVLSSVYRLLCLCLGVPLKEFTFEAMDKDNKVLFLHSTPKEFYERYAKEELESYITLGSFPMEGIPLHSKVTSSLVNNVVEGEPVVFFNCEVKEMKKAIKKELLEGRAVWFAADSNASSDRKGGYFLRDLYRLDEATGIPVKLQKGERLSTRVSTAAHAMAITGLEERKGKILRYQVLNSWGTQAGINGHYTMDDGWVSEYAYQIFVKKTSVSKEVLEAYESAELIEMSPWVTLF